jgi:hypothetical protein
VQIQTFLVLRRPLLAISTFTIAALFGLFFLYFDEFYFVRPYFVVFVSPDRLSILVLDFVISLLSGIVLTISAHEIRSFPNQKGSYQKAGFAGIVAALLAGACPCYYLVPLLAVAGGAGGVLGAFGILFYAYQVPIKLGSLALLLFTSLILERGLRAACAIPGSVQRDSPA